MINENNPGSNRIKLFLVDDDALFLKSLEIEFKQHADFTIDTFYPFAYIAYIIQELSEWCQDESIKT